MESNWCKPIKSLFSTMILNNLDYISHSVSTNRPKVKAIKLSKPDILSME